MRPPGRLSGSNPLIGWLNRLRDTVAANELSSVVNGRLSSSSPSGGSALICGGKGGGGASIIRTKLVSVEDEYLVCHSWDGTTEGEDAINIAKPPELRFSVTMTGYTFAYSSPRVLNSTRTKTTDPGGTSEQQQVTPLWRVGCELYGISCNTGVNTIADPPVPVTYLLISDSRAWAKKTGT